MLIELMYSLILFWFAVSIQGEKHVKVLSECNHSQKKYRFENVLWSLDIGRHGERSSGVFLQLLLLILSGVTVCIRYLS